MSADTDRHADGRTDGPIDFDLIKAMTSKKHAAILRNGYDISAVGVPIWTKFGSLMQNNMHIMANWSRSKPEVEFQYGGRLYFETGSSYISAVN